MYIQHGVVSRHQNLIETHGLTASAEFEPPQRAGGGGGLGLGLGVGIGYVWADVQGFEKRVTNKRCWGTSPLTKWCCTNGESVYKMVLHIENVLTK